MCKHASSLQPSDKSHEKQRMNGVARRPLCFPQAGVLSQQVGTQRHHVGRAESSLGLRAELPRGGNVPGTLPEWEALFHCEG